MKSIFLLAVIFYLLLNDVFCSLLTSATFPDVPSKTKKLYLYVLVKLSLLKYFNNSLTGCKNLSSQRKYLAKNLDGLIKILLSDNMINLMSGYKGKVEGENSAIRMLRIYRNDTYNPFANRICFGRMIRPLLENFPLKISGNEDKWSELMDENKIHFKGAELTSTGKIDFSKWNVEAGANIFNIGKNNFRSVYKKLSTIKFTKKINFGC